MSESIKRPCSFLIGISPPPKFRMICRARVVASAFVRVCALTRWCPSIKDQTDVAAPAASIEFLMSTIPTAFEMKPRLSLVKQDGTLVTVGMLEPSLPGAIDFAAVSMRRITIAGSLIDSIEET